MSLETRSNSALMKRAEQLKRWQESETYKEPGQPKAKKSRRVGFSDGCVFLAACAAGETGEVVALLKRGADIDTANVDGLTALHQACIDDNLEMVEFLIEHGADVNRGDNEGWTPLHATASCGFLSIARYLLDNSADVGSVNNDGELAIDISESDEMEELLQKEITNQRVDCEDARNKEEREMLKDARHWISSGALTEIPHPKTGASALHVAAAKGYMKVMKLLLKAASPVNAQDMDGWTPMHAAAHWAQREACELLVENGADMEIKNCVGQTAFDVSDPDVLRLLEELKKKAASLQKDKPIDLVKLQQDQHQLPPKRSTINNNRSEVLGSNDSISSSDRSSITRLSYDDKILRSKEATVKETIAEEKADKDEKSSDGGRHRGPDSPGLLVTDESGKESAPGFAPPHPDTDGGKEEIAPWRRPGSVRSRPISGLTGSGTGSVASLNASSKLSVSSDDTMVRRAHSFGSDDKFYAKLAELRQRIRANSLPVLHAGAAEPGSTGPGGNTDSNSAMNLSATNQMKHCDIIRQSNTLPRPNKPRLPCLIESASELSPSSLEMAPPSLEMVGLTADEVKNLPDSEAKPPIPPKPSTPTLSFMAARPFSRSADGTTNKLTELASNKLTELTLHDQTRKRLTDDYGKQSPEVLPRNRVDKSLSAQVRRSFVPPVRDEEHEIQRKAHAKRVRETRRSTQGVTLEDLKSAEQLVKKKQQQENAIRTTELNNLAHSDQVPNEPPGSTATTTVNTTATLVPTDSEKSAERRPSWRLRIDSGERSRFTLEDSRNRTISETRQQAADNTQTAPEVSSRHSAAETGGRLHTATSTTLTDRSADRTADRISSSSTDISHSSEPSGRITRPFSATYSNTLHPTDIVSPTTPTQLAISRKKKPKRRSTGVIDMEDLDKSDDNIDENIPTSSSQAAAKSKANTQNGEIDYKKLWEESESENTRLRKELMTIKHDLEGAKHQLESAVQASTKNAISDSEKREKKVLERKLAEMEEELKTLDQLKSDNQRLRDENGALIRVISKLSK